MSKEADAEVKKHSCCSWKLSLVYLCFLVVSALACTSLALAVWSVVEVNRNRFVQSAPDVNATTSSVVDSFESLLSSLQNEIKAVVSMLSGTNPNFLGILLFACLFSQPLLPLRLLLGEGLQWLCCVCVL